MRLPDRALPSVDCSGRARAVCCGRASAWSGPGEPGDTRTPELDTGWHYWSNGLTLLV